MSDINHVTIIGRLTRDPETRHTSSGMSIVSLGIASNRREKQPNGEWGETPGYFDVTLFGERFEKLAQHLTKGSRIGIDGTLRYSSWEKDGAKRSKIEIIGEQVQMLDTKRDTTSEADVRTIHSAFPGATVSDDSIPF